jgi:hypothetical protein
MPNDTILASLEPNARNVALRLLMQFPQLVLTSGRRCVDDQCRAMAENEAEARDWVRRTYAESPVEVAVCSWLDQNPSITDVAGIETGLLGVLAGFDQLELHQLSWHLSGEAFDIQPLTDESATAVTSAIRDEIIAIIQGGGSAKFLPSEGGLLRWHVQVAQTDTNTTPTAS